jgi:glycosyltransferase involved in cell wall biosynthesis
MTMDERGFDGVVCFGGVDWWYHNRGHYDVQMMRELSARMPVLYVNSIGMRVPDVREGAMFRRRIARKLRSLRQGLVAVRPGFSVLTGFALPGPVGAPARRVVLPLQVRRAARSMGIRRPLVWVAVPTAGDIVGALRPAGVVYQRTDRFESFEGVDRERIAALDAALKARADVTLFCSTELYEAEAAACRRAAFVDHGVDFEAFAAAGRGHVPEPADVRTLPRPRAGFVGSIEAHTFDPDLLVALARALPEVQFPLVGECTLPAGWCDAPNVTLLGRRPYEEVAAYMAAADVLLMPWNRSPWIAACNPVKLKEYLAVGRPVVSRPFRELERYAGHVRVADGAEDFAAAVRAALDEPFDPAAGRERVRAETWTAKAQAALDELAATGVAPAVSAPARRRSPRRTRATAAAQSPRP